MNYSGFIDQPTRLTVMMPDGTSRTFENYTNIYQLAVNIIERLEALEQKFAGE